MIIGLPALRLSGLYLALITLMAAAAISIVLQQTNFPNGGTGFLGYDIAGSGTAALRRPAIAGETESFFRYTLVVGALMFLLAWLHAFQNAARLRPGMVIRHVVCVNRRGTPSCPTPRGWLVASVRGVYGA